MLVLIQGRRHKKQNTIVFFFLHGALRDLVLNCFVGQVWRKSAALESIMHYFVRFQTECQTKKNVDFRDFETLRVRC